MSALAKENVSQEAKLQYLSSHHKSLEDRNLQSSRKIELLQRQLTASAASSSSSTASAFHSPMPSPTKSSAAAAAANSPSFINNTLVSLEGYGGSGAGDGTRFVSGLFNVSKP
jgi:hypothetical protein